MKKPTDFMTATEIADYRAYHKATREKMPRTEEMKAGNAAYMRARRLARIANEEMADGTGTEDQGEGLGQG